jgi:membrane-bound serine protease (ClpP class)
VVLDPNLVDAPALVGAAGVAVSDLRPVGICRINDLRLECLAEGGVIDAGRRVKVVSVLGNEVKVRAVS